MEQQTISIAKVVLNSRTFVVAAANPSSGRYEYLKVLSIATKYNIIFCICIISIIIMSIINGEFGKSLLIKVYV